MFGGSRLRPLPRLGTGVAAPEDACPGGKRDGGNYLIYSGYLNRLLERVRQESWHRLAREFP